MSPYSPQAIATLVVCHGAERAALIVAGKDAATQADQAAWARVGGLSVPPPTRDPGTRTPTGLIMTYAARGFEPNEIARRFGVPEAQVLQIIEAHA